MSRAQLLQRSWSEAAAAYQEHMVPRFVPWTLATLDAFGSTRIPEGLVVVPACGPGGAGQGKSRVCPAQIRM